MKKDELISGYKVGIIFAWIFRTLFLLSIYGCVSDIYGNYTTNNLDFFTVFGDVLGLLFAYFIFWKLPMWFQKNCGEQITNVSNGQIIKATVISYRFGFKDGSREFRNMPEYYDTTIYTCKILDTAQEIEVTRLEKNTDIDVGDIITVLKWNDDYRTYFEFNDLENKIK